MLMAVVIVREVLTRQMGWKSWGACLFARGEYIHDSTRLVQTAKEAERASIIYHAEGPHWGSSLGAGLAAGLSWVKTG